MRGGGARHGFRPRTAQSIFNKAALILSALFLWATFLGCAFFSTTIILTVELPQIPGHWREAFGDISFLLTFPNPEGGVSEKIIPSRSDQLEIRILKRNNLPVLVYPLVKNQTITLPPAGSIYPLLLSGGESEILRLTWKQGFAAQIIFRLWLSGMDVSGLNSERLTREITARSGGDPWSLDFAGIVLKLSQGDFRVTAIKKTAGWNVELIPGEGLWFLESPFSIPVRKEMNEILLLENLPRGFHRLFDARSGSYFELYLRDEDDFQYFRRE